MNDRFPTGGFPSGWYVVCLSSELAKGDVRPLRYFGRDWVAYRTQRGEPRVVDATCPHLGASLGLAKVRGEHLVCQMHGFEFDPEGRCAKIAYGTRPPRRAQLVCHYVHEVNGLVMVYFDAQGRPPAWRVSELDDAGWTSIRHTRVELAGHPQEITENSVDVGHFRLVHHYEHAWVVAEPSVEGPRLRANYGARRSLAVFGAPRLKIDQLFSVTVEGLGYSLVEGSIPGTPSDIRLFVCSTPIDTERVHLNLGVAVRRLALPGAHLGLREIIFRILCHDVSQDVPFWASKRYLESPALAEGDGPIPIYRRWCRQFYPSANDGERLRVVGD